MSTLNADLVNANEGVHVTTQALGAISGAQSISISAGSYISATASGAIAWVFNIPADSRSCEWKVEITNGGTSQTFAVSVGGAASVPVEWADGAAPSLTSAGTDLIQFVRGVDKTIGYRVARNIS